MRHWRLNEVETPDGTRSPVVLHTREGAERAILIGLRPGESLGDHGVKESTLILVLDGEVRIDAGDESVAADTGTLIHFEPDERHSVRSGGGARLLLLLAPWPGAGHYRGDWSMPADVSAS